MGGSESTCREVLEPHVYLERCSPELLILVNSAGRSLRRLERPTLEAFGRSFLGHGTATERLPQNGLTFSVDRQVAKPEGVLKL